MNVELIDRADDLRKFIEKFSALPFIGIDTEFEKLRTFYPILGAFQVMAGDTAYILDPKGMLPRTVLEGALSLRRHRSFLCR